MHAYHVFSQKLADAFFPVRCLGCRTYDTWLCDDCHTRLPLITEQKCPLCDCPTTPDGATCLLCTKQPTTFIDGIFVVSLYRDSLVRRLIHAYKYQFVVGLASPLALLMAQGLSHTHLSTPHVLIPVPLHKRRQRWRGFNHAEILAKELSLTIPLRADILRRIRYTPPQAKYRKRERRIINLKQAFSINDKFLQDVKGMSILLIDDVSTTGTTMNACAEALKQAGALRVTGLVLAKE